ncbi:MAG TPA: hypothetical protein VFB34_10375 [Chloroflexota bacterium]|nr:hypothetical protein [Chloroflexota bacterium]
MLIAGVELVLAVSALIGGGLLVLQAWDRQNEEHRARRRSRRP